MSFIARFDWVGFLVNFTAGALIGAVVGFAVWVKSPLAWLTSTHPGFYCIGGGAAIFGLLAGFLGDRFWKNFGKLFP